MNTFIRVAEIWLPSADGHLLELADGLYQAAPAFGESSRGMCFGRAEGLPGHAWEDGRPLLLRGFANSHFRRAAAAEAAGLTCAVALPIFVDDRLTSLVVLLCGDSAPHSGAIEMWRNDPRVGSDMTLAEGYFGNGDSALEDLSRDSSLPRGTGLPGLAWQRETAVYIDNVGQSHHFLRSQAAASAGIVRGLAIPCGTRHNETWVLSLLSSTETPIARRVESWIGDDASGGLQRAFGFCESAGALPTAGASATPAAGLGAIGRAWVSARAECSGGMASIDAAEPHPAGLQATLAIPVISDGAVSEVLALHW